MAGVVCVPVTAESPNTITLRIINEAGIAADTLEEGRLSATGILRQAGIEVRWLDCTRQGTLLAPACRTSRGPAEFTIYILDEKDSEVLKAYRRVLHPTSRGELMLGFTLTSKDPAADLRIAGVYYPKILATAKRFAVGTGKVLGSAMAHEIGHLSGVGHPQSGAEGGSVMTALFGRRQAEQIQKGQLGFSEEEATLLRRDVARRLESLR